MLYFQVIYLRLYCALVIVTACCQLRGPSENIASKIQVRPFICAQTPKPPLITVHSFLQIYSWPFKPGFIYSLIKISLTLLKIEIFCTFIRLSLFLNLIVKHSEHPLGKISPNKYFISLYEPKTIGHTQIVGHPLVLVLTLHVLELSCTCAAILYFPLLIVLFHLHSTFNHVCRSHN